MQPDNCPQREHEEKHLPEVDKDLFRLLLEFKDYAVIHIGASGEITSWNLGAQHIYGYQHEEVVGRHLAFLHKGVKDEEHIKRSLHEALQNGRVEEEGWKQRKDGTAFYANTILTALYHEDGRLKGFAKVTRDITLQKKLEEENRLLHEQQEEKIRQRTRELEIVNKELEAFSYSVSHDLRTPLRAISGFSMILKEDYGSQLDAEANRLIDTIVANTRMMGELIDDLLTFSKMARLEAIHEAVNMNKLVEILLSEVPYDLDRYTITVNDLPACSGDPTMLKQVWVNLIGNAIKYSSKNEAPKIEMGTLDNTAFHIYYIRDNGVGFDMRYVSKLFGVFQRLHRQDEFEGTGLGLALAKRIISKHGGDIWTDALPGKGATFYFSIPKNKS